MPFAFSVKMPGETLVTSASAVAEFTLSRFSHPFVVLQPNAHANRNNVALCLIGTNPTPAGAPRNAFVAYAHRYAIFR